MTLEKLQNDMIQAMKDKDVTARDVLRSVIGAVDASCCAGVTPEKHAAALEVMKSCQIDVINE